MSALIRRVGEHGMRYEFRDATCIGKHCFAPGKFQHRGATTSGSRATGDVTRCCLSRAYRGCPTDAYLPDLAKQRKDDGWRVV